MSSEFTYRARAPGLGLIGSKTLNSKPQNPKPKTKTQNLKGEREGVLDSSAVESIGGAVVEPIGFRV